MNTVTEPVPATEMIGPTQAENYAVETVSAARESRAMAALTLAFAADPAVRWLLPDPDSYLAGFPCPIRAFGGSALRLGHRGAGQDRAPWRFGLDLARRAGSVEVVGGSLRATPGRRSELLSSWSRSARLAPLAFAANRRRTLGARPRTGLGAATPSRAVRWAGRISPGDQPRNVPLPSTTWLRRLEVLRVGVPPSRRCPSATTGRQLTS
jgi:hypothetical protein